ncbi:hypothetical protein BDP27DRAFT_1426927 [Rhodocollybia butyracea]|uniref:Uncharacterized protein n=1 Tax=Rhodocollybia butyracea TaxID=206335 RepID=A0A9P5PHD4_9AGAR|nr:hypothetical protein BDP27DRAFT_1426927 [Rhodocollybia butyracea]
MLSKVILIAAGFIAAASAAPAVSPVNIKFCTAAGVCSVAPIAAGSCVPFTLSNITSVIVSGGATCEFFSTNNCTGGAVLIMDIPRNFVLEVISNLQQISVTEDPTTVFAASPIFVVLVPPSTTLSLLVANHTLVESARSSAAGSMQHSSTNSFQTTTTGTVSSTTATATDQLSPTQSVVSPEMHISNTPAIVGNDMAILNASISPFIKAGSDSKYIVEQRKRQKPDARASQTVIVDGILPEFTFPTAHSDVPLVSSDTWGEDLRIEDPELAAGLWPGSPIGGSADEPDIAQIFENIKNRVTFRRHQDSGLVVSVRNVQDRELGD